MPRACLGFTVLFQGLHLQHRPSAKRPGRPWLPPTANSLVTAPTWLDPRAEELWRHLRMLGAAQDDKGHPHFHSPEAALKELEKTRWVCT